MPRGSGVGSLTIFVFTFGAVVGLHCDDESSSPGDELDAGVEADAEAPDDAGADSDAEFPEDAGATVVAASCSQQDVQAALDSAVEGDVILIPSGTCTWTAPIEWTAPPDVTLRGAGSQSILGGGDATVIIDDIDRTVNGDRAALAIQLSESGRFRLSALTIRGSGNPNALTWNGTLRIGGTSSSARVDHIHLDRVEAVAMLVDGQIYGVMDNCIVDMIPGSMNNGVRVWASAWQDGEFGDGSWADATTLGSSRFFVVESCTFNEGIVDDCTSGGRMVIRHNTLNNTGMQTHPTGGGGRGRGCRALEIYGNTLVAPDADPQFNVYFLSSGTGVIWGNSAPAGYANFVSIHSMRKDDSTYPESAPPDGWGYCGTEFNGAGSAWDENADTATGYACIDQPGRGQGDLLANEFPDAVNTVTGTVAWPHQALEPVYEWLNDWNPAPGYSGARWANYSPTVLAENRDFYSHAASFDGSSGVGSGTLATRPATCTPQVAYWATDTSTLYQCSAADTWTEYYQPLPYPYPLDAEGYAASPG